MPNKDSFTDEELVSRIQEGSSEDMDLLMERYKGQVRQYARTLYLMGGDSDDMIQEGMLGLFKAIRDYQPQKGVAFASFARLCIRRQLYTAVQAAGRQKHAPLNTYVELSEELEALREESSPEELLIARESLEGLKQEIRKKLSPLERKILKSYMRGRSYEQIAAEVGRPPKSVDNAMQRIRRKLRRY